MAPISLSSLILTPKRIQYAPVPLSPYLDGHAASLSNSVLCPHYAESDVSDTPSSPASIESFSILDPIAWRRGYTSYNYGDDHSGRLYKVMRKRWRKNRAQILTAIMFFTLLVVGCAAGGWAILQHESSQLEGICMTREGGDRCQEQAWAKCVAVNGVGYCEGVL